MVAHETGPLEARSSLLPERPSAWNAPASCCLCRWPGAYDYKLPRGVNAARGTLVAAPLGNRESLGVVWGAAEGTVGDNRLKIAEPLEGAPAPARRLVRFHRLGGGLHPQSARARFWRWRCARAALSSRKPAASPM